AVSELLTRIRTAPGEAAAPTWKGVDPAHVAGSQDAREPGDSLSPAGLLDPRSLVRELDALIPANRVIASDGGHFLGWIHSYFRFPTTDTVALVGTQFQSIGLGFSSAPGAAAAAPDRTLVVNTGDGGGLMAIADLDSVVR